MPVAIGLDAVRQLRQARISRDFHPMIQVEPSLRLEIRKLDHDGHTGKIRQKHPRRAIFYFAFGTFVGI